MLHQYIGNIYIYIYIKYEEAKDVRCGEGSRDEEKQDWIKRRRLSCIKKVNLQTIWGKVSHNFTRISHF